MNLQKKDIHQFQQSIFSWWGENRRDLPWRRTCDPYRIFISEVMLQQTQVSRVLPKYTEFLRVFPTVFDLAQASPAHILRIWKGMGYNRRALYLFRAAKTIVGEYQGKFPKSEKELIKLPGLGRYTARAILVFAYEKDVPLVDTNIRQIITHFFFNDKPQKESDIEDVARQLLPKGKSWEWHQALMDYGALAMKSEKLKVKNVKKAAVPFKESDRFYRGRIVNRLRDGAIPEQELIDEVARGNDKPIAYIRTIIASLITDGLIDRSSRGFLRLPR